MLDTNIVSVLLKASTVHQERREKIEQTLSGKVGLISFITVAELLFWAEDKGWGTKRKADLEERLSSYVVLDPTRTTCDLWASTKKQMSLEGKGIEAHDLWIAASALEREVPLVTADGVFATVPNLEVIAL